MLQRVGALYKIEERVCGKDGSGDPPAGGRNGERDFHGEKRSNETLASTSDADARLYKKAVGQAARLCHMGHVVMENRNGSVVASSLTRATGTAGRAAVPEMVEPLGRGITLGADKDYDTQDFVSEMRRLGVTPHVTQKSRHSTTDRRTTRHESHTVTLRVRKRIEEVFGWMKSVGGLRKARHRGTGHRRGRLDVHLYRGCLQPGPYPKLLATG